jgi:Bacterial regulatory proteins, luxR family
MDRKQKEALVLAMLEKGESYREIAQKAKVSPNTIKAISNRAGLDETTSISSRAFELFSEGKAPLQVAIILKLEAETTIQYHEQYLMLLGCTEFTRIYPIIKNNPLSYVSLVKLAHNCGINDDDVIKLLEIAKGHLPRVKLEYDRLNKESNSWKAEISKSVRTYQQFVDRNIALKNREDELHNTISELEAKQTELQGTLDGLKQQISALQDDNAVNTSLNSEVKLNGISTNDSMAQPPPNTAINYHQIEHEMHHFHPKVEPISRTLIFDTKDFFQ